MSFPEFNECRSDGCHRWAETSGYCNVDYTRLQNRKRQRTSDGKPSGNIKKLSEHDIAEVRRMYACLKTRTEIARHFGVSLSVIRKALAR